MNRPESAYFLYIRAMDQIGAEPPRAENDPAPPAPLGTERVPVSAEAAPELMPRARMTAARKRVMVGALHVLLAASCYGLQSTLVKLAYAQGYTPADALISQFVIGAVTLGLVSFMLSKRRGPGRPARADLRSTLALMAGGTTIGLTGAFYYLAVAQTSVSGAIVLLMQSVWMGVALDAILTRRWPPAMKWASSAVIILGAVLATGYASNGAPISVLGLVFGLLGAACYTGVIWCSEHVAVDVAPIERSFIMILGGAAASIAVFAPRLSTDLHASVFWTWGCALAVTGTILPPFLFARGAPATGIGLAAILASAELPIAILSAVLVLGESFLATQWLGVALILGAVALSNLRAEERMRD